MADNVDQMSSKTTREMKKRGLLKNAMKGQWREVVEIYKNEAWIHKEKITRSGETALHIAVSDGQKKIVKQLITAIKSQIDDQNHAKEAVSVKNRQGNTALHFAASKGMEPMCKVIAEVNSFLVGCPNREGETPFFLAAFHGKKEAFLCLHQICTETNQDGYGYSTRNDGNTTLHSSINGQHFDLALEIIQLYPTLANRVNNEGLYPLHILAAKPSAFKSGKPPASIWHRAVFNRKFIVWFNLDKGAKDRNIPKRDDRDQNPETDQLSIAVEDSGRSHDHDHGDHRDQTPEIDEVSGRHDHDILGGCISSQPIPVKVAFWTVCYPICIIPLLSLLLIIIGSVWIISSMFKAIFTRRFIKAMLLLPFGIKGTYIY
ncbi:hypothetical protein I3843_Q008300 [Carya illinoinensis]|nr:hypothetical protein I3843_Q008300 [Carya illinoinensis]KAG6671215.1 hypothetical protein I3843_Q008300 [Carya illinoinensis]